MMIVAVPALAALVSSDASGPIPNIDHLGNPTWENAGEGSGKVYKENRTGIVVGILTGTIRNAFAAPVVIRNQGYSFVDPWTNDSQTATADIEAVTRPIALRARAALVFAYVPSDTLPP
jgi:hypothetical protein